jgi:allantoinase
LKPKTPAAAEASAIARVLRLAREMGARVHILHLSDAGSLPLIEEARTAGVRVTVETCPHYLFFQAEEIADGDTSTKCAPPIRGRENRERLWDGLRRGAIDLVASDHSPSPRQLKLHEGVGDFERAWGGIASLELGLAAVWTAARERGVAPERLAEWMSAAPARLAGLGDRGRIAPGCVADFVVWDPDLAFRPEPQRLFQKHDLTPYLGRPLHGMVRATLRRGEKIFEKGRLLARSRGEELRRP